MGPGPRMGPIDIFSLVTGSRSRELEKFQTAKVAFEVIQGHWRRRHSIATYDFLLVFRCNYISILHRLRDIITYVPKFKEVT